MVSSVGQPVARVLVDVGARQVDRLFDFSVPDKLDSDAVVGARVRVRFSGRLVNGFIQSRKDFSDFDAELKPIERVLGPAVLTPEIAELTQEVAEAYVGTWSDVVRCAVPPRHVEAEKLVMAVPAAKRVPAARSIDAATMEELGRYSGGTVLVERLAQSAGNDKSTNDSTRASLTVSPSVDGEWLVASLAAGLPGTTLILAPDSRSVGRIRLALKAASTNDDLHVEVLDSAESPRNRYSAYLRVLRGEADVVIGTRDAVFAPVPSLDRIIMWDEGSEHYRDQRSPMWHARRVALMRSRQVNCDLVLVGYSPSAEVTDLINSGWLKAITLPQQLRREGVAEVVTEAAARASDFGGERVPGVAWRAIKSGVEVGPVLVSVPRAGYVRFIACADCDAALECANCGGALQQTGLDAKLTCQACAHEVETPECAECGSTRFRMASVGASRILEELRRAFPRTTIVESSAKEGVISRVSSDSQIVVATIGAEPIADGRFQTTVVLDGMFTLRGVRLDAGQEAVHHWMRLAAATKSANDGGTLVLTGNPASRVVQAILRMDPLGWASQDLQERAELGLPPTFRYIQLRAAATELDAFLEYVRPYLESIEGLKIVDLIPDEGKAGALVITPARQSRALSGRLGSLVHQWFGVKSYEESHVPPPDASSIPLGSRELRVEVDPATL